MASVSAIRCKRWREKRKDDEEFRNKEKERKREARRTRSVEKKRHDRELSRKRQKTFRDRKKARMRKGSSSDIEVDGTTSETGIVTEDPESGNMGPESGNMGPESGNMVPESGNMGPESDTFMVSSFLETEPETDGTVNVDSLLNPQAINRIRSAAPHINLIQIKDEAGADIVYDDIARQAYFETIQTKLSQIEDFNIVKFRCNSISQYIDQTYPIRDLPTLVASGYSLDNVASSLYPHGDSPNNLVPICTVGDGNCLPRVGSLFAFGDEKFHVEIRVRVFMELCQFEESYLDDSYLSRGTEQAVKNIAMTIAQHCSTDDVMTDTASCREAFRKYTKTILQPKTFNGMWSIFALASVLGVEIFSIYPSYGGYNVRAYLHRQVKPRIFRQGNNRKVHIMWTSTHGKRQQPLSWTPNHFVAVLPTRDPIYSRVQELRVGPGMINVGTNQRGYDVRIGVAPSNPMETPSTSRLNEEVENPAFITLQNDAREYPTISLYQEARGRTTLLKENKHVDTSMSSSSVSEAAADGKDTKQRQENRCISHPNEELLYLCTSCRGIPICYKCHLQGHQYHTLTDLKVCLAESESLYVNQLAKKSEQQKENTKKQKLDHAQNMQCAESEIDDAHTFYKEQLTTWVCNQKALMHERDQIINQDLEAQLRKADTSVEDRILELRTLPVSQRLSVMSTCTEPEQECQSSGYPRRTKLVFRKGRIHLLNMLGTLAEIPCQSDTSSKDGTEQAAIGSEPLVVPEEDNGMTSTEREDHKKSTDGDTLMAIRSGIVYDNMGTTNKHDTMVEGLKTDMPEPSTFTPIDHAWIPRTKETFTNNHQQLLKGQSRNVQSFANSGFAEFSLNGTLSHNVQNSAGTHINTAPNQDPVIFGTDTSNENMCTRMGTHQVSKRINDVETAGPNNNYGIGLPYHIHRRTTDKETQPYVQVNFSRTSLKQRDCDPGLTGQIRKENQNIGYHKDHEYESENLVFDKSVPTVNHSSVYRQTPTPTIVLASEANVVNQFRLSDCLCPKYFKSFGTTLYIYGDLSKKLLQVSKFGVILTETKLNVQHIITNMCISPVDKTIWYLCVDSIIIRRMTSSVIQLMFKVTDKPVLILVRSSGDVLVVKCTGFPYRDKLTLYTATGQEIRTIESPKCVVRIKECPQTNEIALHYYKDSNVNMKLFDSLLENSRDIDLGENLDHVVRDVCFDGRGHVLVCYSDIIKMFEQRTCLPIRTVCHDIALGPSICTLALCDVDDDNVLWVVHDRKVTGFQL